MVQTLPSSAAPFLPLPPSLAQLPHLVLEHEHTPVNAGWPRVSAGHDASQVTALRSEKPAPSPASALLDGLDELLSVRDPHAVFQAALRVSHQHLGLHAPALLLVDESGEHLCGTFRADPDGSLIDERDTSLKLGLIHRQAAAKAKESGGRYTVLSAEDFPREIELNNSTRTPPWTVLTPIFGRERLIGFLENAGDELGGELDVAVQNRTALLCRALGGLLDAIQRRSKGLPWDPVLTRKPLVPTTRDESLVASVLRIMHDDASASNRELAARLGVSTSRLSTVFHNQTGLPLTQYRNRLRIERFFTQINRSGGNLFQAALEAGFGSYPHFHRVFRELLDATPRDFLAELG